MTAHHSILFGVALCGLFCSAPARAEEPALHLGIVLLSKAELPATKALIESYAKFPGPGKALVPTEAASPAGKGAEKKSEGPAPLGFDLGDGVEGAITLSSVPFPKGEAENHADYSLSFPPGQKPESLGTHRAHLLVGVHGGEPKTLASLERFTRFIAAITDATPHALGVYWAGARATHSREFLLDLAKAPEAASKLILWNGFKLALLEDGRPSVLSLGMSQLGILDLWIVGPKGTDLPSLIEWEFNLLAYAMNRGSAIPDGDTMGLTETQSILVKHVTSPIDPEKKVWKIELPTE